MSQWGLARLRSTSGPHRGAGAGQGLRRTTVGRWPPNHKPCTSKCPAACTLVGSVWQLEQTCAWQGMLPCRTAMAVGPPATSCCGCSLPGPMALSPHSPRPPATCPRAEVSLPWPRTHLPGAHSDHHCYPTTSPGPDTDLCTQPKAKGCPGACGCCSFNLKTLPRLITTFHNKGVPPQLFCIPL